MSSFIRTITSLTTFFHLYPSFASNIIYVIVLNSCTRVTSYICGWIQCCL